MTSPDAREEEVPGRHTIEDGEPVNNDIDDGGGFCHYDFKAIFEDGDVLIKHDINVCRIESYISAAKASPIGNGRTAVAQAGRLR